MFQKTPVAYHSIISPSISPVIADSQGKNGITRFRCICIKIKSYKSLDPEGLILILSLKILIVKTLYTKNSLLPLFKKKILWVFIIDVLKITFLLSKKYLFIYL